MSEPRYEILKPREGLVVLKERSRQRLATDGERVRITPYYQHLIDDPDHPVTIVAQPKAGKATKEAP